MHRAVVDNRVLVHDLEFPWAASWRGGYCMGSKCHERRHLAGAELSNSPATLIRSVARPNLPMSLKAAMLRNLRVRSAFARLRTVPAVGWLLSRIAESVIPR